MVQKKADTPETNPTTPSAPETISKMEAVRRAIGKMGKDAMPIQMKPWILEQFGIDMSADHISVCKGKIVGKAKKGSAKKPSQPAAPTAVQKAPVVRPAALPAVAGAVSLQDVATLKTLLERVGPNSLRTLIELLAK